MENCGSTPLKTVRVLCHSSLMPSMIRYMQYKTIFALSFFILEFPVDGDNAPINSENMPVSDVVPLDQCYLLQRGSIHSRVISFSSLGLS